MVNWIWNYRRFLSIFVWKLIEELFVAMVNKYDLKIEKVHDYNAFMGVEDQHTFVSIIHYDDLLSVRHCLCLWGIYGVFLLEDAEESLFYGTARYNYSKNSIVCVAPSQIGGSPNDGTYFKRRGWALLFSPELFHGKSFEKTLHRFEFFKYHNNEALTIDSKERLQMTNLMEMLQAELDMESQDSNLIEKIIELVLVFCSKQFHKQYKLPANTKRFHIVSRLENTLDDYYQADLQYLLGLPKVKYCAEQLCVATNYLGDLIKEETGENVHMYIAKYIIRRAKTMLMSGKSVTETAYSLGFDYLSHFGRFFKGIEGKTPREYVRWKKTN